MFYKMNVAGLERALPLCKLNEELTIGAFVVFGDVELTVACARELLKLLPEDFDYIVSPEAKAIPLAHEMARQSGRNKYVLARKVKKAYMQNILETEDVSITTKGIQKLFMDGKDAEMIKGKKVVIVDDVISTGGSLKAVEELINQAGAEIVGRYAVLAEGNAADRKDICFLEKLPLFDSNGDPLN